MSKRRTKTFSEGLSRRFDKAKEYPQEPDNRTLERLLDSWDFLHIDKATEKTRAFSRRDVRKMKNALGGKEK